MSDQAEGILSALTAEGLQVSELQPKECWSVKFDIDGRSYATLLIGGRGVSYFLILCPVVGLRLRSIKDATIEELRRIIHLSSEGSLARLEYHEVDTVGAFVAVSECSTEGYTGLKLRRRMEACAQMAARIYKEFGKNPSPSTQD